MNDSIQLILWMMLVTIVTRYPVLVLLGKLQLPAPFRKALEFVPVAVLTAICAPVIFMPEQSLLLDWHSPHLVAGLIATAVAWRYQRLLLTLFAGMLVFFIWKFIWPGLG